MKNMTKILKVNNNTFEQGDEVTLIMDSYSPTILHGNLHISDNGYYVCHNNEDYDYDNSPEKYGNKYAYYIYYSDDESLLYHKIDIELLYTDVDRAFKKGVRTFLQSQLPYIFPLFNIKLGVIDNYATIKESEKQGFVDLSSGKPRNKKLSTKLGRLTGKLAVAFGDKVKENQKNSEFKLKDEIIEKIHNQWMSSHESVLKYEFLGGEDILIGYTKSNYVNTKDNRKSVLHNSCMGDKQDLLKIYTQNPDKISLMVFYNEEKKINGRCLIWKADDGNTYFDRIYYINDWFEYSMEKTCVNLGFIKINASRVEAKVSLQNIDFRNYPYLDTFHFISFKKKALYHNPLNTWKLKYELRTTTGQIFEKTIDIPEIELE